MILVHCKSGHHALTVPVYVPVCCDEHDDKKRSQGRNLEAGAEAEAMKGCCLVACSTWFAQLVFL